MKVMEAEQVGNAIEEIRKLLYEAIKITRGLGISAEFAKDMYVSTREFCPVCGARVEQDWDKFDAEKRARNEEFVEDVRRLIDEDATVANERVEAIVAQLASRVIDAIMNGTTAPHCGTKMDGAYDE